MGISTYEERLAIVMELLDGDLDTLLIKNAKEAAAKLSLYQRLLMARDAVLGMNWLHSREPAIIHRFDIQVLSSITHAFFVQRPKIRKFDGNFCC